MNNCMNVVLNSTRFIYYSLWKKRVHLLAIYLFTYIFRNNISVKNGIFLHDSCIDWYYRIHSTKDKEILWKYYNAIALGGFFPKTLKPKNFSFEQTSLIYLPQTLFNNCLQERHVLEVCGCAGIPFANCINFMLQSCLGIWIFGKIIHSETERMWRLK